MEIKALPAFVFFDNLQRLSLRLVRTDGAFRFCLPISGISAFLVELVGKDLAPGEIVTILLLL